MADAATGRVPPFSHISEVATLGCVILNNETLPVIRSIIDKDDFYLETHRLIYNSMCELADEGVAIDHITLGMRLKLKNELGKVGGAVALSGITDVVPTTVNAEHYAGIVREQAGVRRVIYSAQELAARALDTPSADSIEKYIADLTDATNGLARMRMPKSLLETGAEVIELYAKVMSGYRGIELPWPTVTNMTAGLWPKTVTIFVARPGVGKSFTMVIIARHAWLAGKRVLIISPEMSKSEIGERFFVTEAEVSYDNVVHGQLSDFEYPKLVEVVSKLNGQDGIWIMDSEDDLTPHGMEAAIRACNPELVAIDSIYDIKVKGERRDRVLAALDWMKSSAKKMGYACVGFAQQNRVAELSEKKGGGARLGTIALADEIGQDSHAVFALEQTKDMKADKQMRIKTLKLRRGTSRRDVLVNWDFDKMEFSELAEGESEDYSDAKEDVPF